MLCSKPTALRTLRALQGDPTARAEGLKREAGDDADDASSPALPPQR
jgi:hypothetical protein